MKTNHIESHVTRLLGGHRRLPDASSPLVTNQCGIPSPSEVIHAEPVAMHGPDEVLVSDLVLQNLNSWENDLRLKFEAFTRAQKA